MGGGERRRVRGERGTVEGGDTISLVISEAPPGG